MPYVLTLCAEDFFQHLVVDKRLRHEVPVQIQTKASDFIHAQGKWYLSVIGPTTSIRMEPHADFVGQQGVKVIIGKGGMGDGTKAALQKYKQVYVQACPGCAVVLAAGIVGTKEPHWFEHGMPEAMWPLQAKHFGPFLVTMDSHGNSRYDKVRDYAQKVEKEILATK